jgi:hypothetical protein
MSFIPENRNIERLQLELSAPADPFFGSERSPIAGVRKIEQKSFVHDAPKAGTRLLGKA